jgi:hypothetical protein
MGREFTIRAAVDVHGRPRSFSLAPGVAIGTEDGIELGAAVVFGVPAGRLIRDSHPDTDRILIRSCIMA